MTQTLTPIPIPPRATVRAAHDPPAGELAHMSDAELIALRRALAHALAELWLGSRPSLLLGRLSRQTRAELRRRERLPGGPSAA